MKTDKTTIDRLIKKISTVRKNIIANFKQVEDQRSDTLQFYLYAGAIIKSLEDALEKESFEDEELLRMLRQNIEYFEACTNLSGMQKYYMYEEIMKTLDDLFADESGEDLL